MFKPEFEAVKEASNKKIDMLKNNFLGYLIMSILAGIYIGIGVILTNTIGAQLKGAPYTKFIMGVTFSVGLSLVVFAGAELFTGNNFVMTVGLFANKITKKQLAKIWSVCWLGNLIGSILLAGIYHLTALEKGAIIEFMINVAKLKVMCSPIQLISRGLLCNMLVCLAIWSTFRLKSESGKLIMIAWCILSFITTGFEHSVANMTLFATVLMEKVNVGVTIGQCAYNLFYVTLGNIIGGVFFVAVPYYTILNSGNKSYVKDDVIRSKKIS